MCNNVYEVSSCPVPVNQRARAGNLPEWFYERICDYAENSTSEGRESAIQHLSRILGRSCIRNGNQLRISPELKTFFFRNAFRCFLAAAKALAKTDYDVFAGLDWSVEQRDVYTGDGAQIPGYKVNLRSTDNAALGIVSDRYKVVQNEDAFQFTDDLLGEGVTYEAAGALQGGRKVWLLARMPQRYVIAGDEITSYMVFMNSHDGSSGVKVAMTPIRVVCQNTLNLALNRAKRIWAAKHTENILNRIHEARETLMLAEAYMGELGRGIDELSRIKLSDRKTMELMQEFFPVTEDMNGIQKKNNLHLLEDLKQRYWDAPDLTNMGRSGYRFINAVSDFATHADPLRKTRNYSENLFLRTIEGNPLIDKAYKMVLAAA